MTLKTTLVNTHGTNLHAEDYWSLRRSNLGDHHVLVTSPPASVHGTFKSATRTSAGTTQLVVPNANGSILVTDILISGEKQAGSSTEVRFTDDSQTESIFLASAVDAPPSFAHTFHGRLQGWRDARIDMVTTGAGDSTVTVCYVKVPEGLLYAAWDALR